MAEDKEKDIRTCLYHKDCPEGKIFDSDEEISNALKKGWVDSPANIDAEKKKCAK